MITSAALIASLPYFQSVNYSQRQRVNWDERDIEAAVVRQIAMSPKPIMGASYWLNWAH